VNDYKTGIWKTFYPGGVLMSEINFKLGQRDNQAKAYTKDGKLAETRMYKNGEEVK
jgi:antitoxin component YwqK of YwqJK toxin-antitoxin module